jgi:hypothetical protein
VDGHNVEGLKAIWRRVARNFYFGMHDEDVNELCEPVASHWHLLMSFGSGRDLSTVQNYFAEYAIGEEHEKTWETKTDDEKESEEFKERLRKNSFEKIGDIKWAKRYLIHFDDPGKHRYAVSDVETNDVKFPDLFLEYESKVEETRHLDYVMQQAGEFGSYSELYRCLENHFARMPPGARLSNYINLRRFYDNEKRSLEEEKIRRDWDYGYVAPEKTDREKLIEKEMEDLPF